MAKKKDKICLLFCGGTIAMAPDEEGALKPALTPEQLYSIAPNIEEYADFDFIFITDIDSSDMGVEEWKKIIDTINKKMDKYDAFVITHGTDTMVNTASAVALAFGRNLKKPVIITGAQAAPHHLGGDARVNLERAVLTATSTKRNEVIISFHDYVFRGPRTQKKSERRLAAFHTPSEPPLGEHMGDKLHWFVDPDQEFEAPDVKLLNYFNPRVVQISIQPAADAEYIMECIFERKKKDRIAGLVWVSLGAGNLPARHHDSIRQANDLNIPIVVTSQFPGGKLNMRAYKAGLDALKLGVVPAEDMTPEAAGVKLRWALGIAEMLIEQKKLKRKDLIDFVRKMFLHDRAGEITLDESKPLPFKI